LIDADDDEHHKPWHRLLCYNESMKETQAKVSVMQILRITALLWLGYLVALAAIDLALHPPEQPFQYSYTVANGLIGLMLLGLTMQTWVQEKLGRAFLPLMIVLMSVSPILTNYRYTPELPRSASASGGLVMLLMALVLTAWQYRWRYVGVYCLGVLGIHVGLLIFSGRPIERAEVMEILFMIVQTIGFLVIGYFINALIAQLRSQQDSLEQANAQMVHHASTLEHLTISRERNRMARELHDTLAHTLSGLTVQLETVKAYWNVDAAAAQTMLDKSLWATRSGLQETRRALKSLRASPLEDLGLCLALRRLAESAADRANLTLDLPVPEQIPSLSPDVEQCIYRVVQEAVTNAARHAGAKNLQLRLTCTDNQISLMVRDDGTGFDATESEHPDHFGVAGMQERAQLAGGRLTIDSEPGQGTTVRLTIQGIEQ
jgi:signal transduction histidine kinase